MEAQIDPELQVFFDNARETFTAEQSRYLAAHPELRQLLSDYVAKLLMSKPEDVYQFTRLHFKFFEKRSRGCELRPLVITAPSGCGKGTLISRLLRDFPHVFAQSLSDTTREPRAGEVCGYKYIFTTKAKFEENIAASNYLEHVSYNGEYYGTNRRVVEEILASGRLCIVEIEMKGARKIKQCGFDCNFLFVAPPTFETLRERLQKRGSETPARLESRLAIARDELEEAAGCDFFTRLVNDDFEVFYAQVLGYLQTRYSQFNFTAPLQPVSEA